jgi:ketosteroid isomerase-like protein
MAVDNLSQCAATMTQAYESFYEGRYEALVGLLAPSVVMRIVAPPVLHPYHGIHFGKDAVVSAWKAMQIEFDVVDFRVLDVIVDHARESAAVRHWSKVRHRGTSAVTSIECHDQLRVHGECVSSITSYLDSVKLAFAAGIDLPLYWRRHHEEG